MGLSFKNKCSKVEIVNDSASAVILPLEKEKKSQRELVAGFIECNSATGFLALSCYILVWA